MNDPFVSNSIFLKHIPEINGWGVFANKDIVSGSVIEMSPIISYPHKIMDIALFMTMAEGVRKEDLKIDQYAIQWEEEGIGAIMLGYLSLYNHSNNNNARFFADYNRNLVSVITLRNITANEQITVSYGADWFEKKKDYVNYIDF